MRKRLIIYAKRPLPGCVKTRLGTAMGHEPAAGVYARLLYTYLIDIIGARLPDTALELATASAQDVAYFEHAFPELIVKPQVAGDLGTRMHASFQRAFREGTDAAVLTGSDIPGLDAAVIQKAFELLNKPAEPRSQRGVIGPAADGGYYLLGMRAPGADLFGNVTWSTDAVLRQTYELAEVHNVRLEPLPGLADLDLFEDYTAWRDRVLAMDASLKRSDQGTDPPLRLSPQPNSLPGGE